jgi:TolB protein
MAAMARAAEPRRLTADGQFKQRPTWRPDGLELLFSRHLGDAIFVYALPLASGNQEERRLTERKLPEFDAVYAPDGKQVALTLVSQSGTQGDLDVGLISLTAGEVRIASGTRGALSHEEWPAFSPDGKRLAFTSTRDKNQELYVLQLEDGSEQRVTSDPAIDAHPAWSPDGTRLAFATARWGDLEIALIDPDGTNLVRLTESPGLDDYPAWSPDGRRLAFVSNRDGNFEIYLCNADGSQAANLTQHEAIDSFPAFSPDGRQLAFISNRSGGFEIYLVELPD